MSNEHLENAAREWSEVVFRRTHPELGDIIVFREFGDHDERSRQRHMLVTEEDNTCGLRSWHGFEAFWQVPEGKELAEWLVSDHELWCWADQVIAVLAPNWRKSGP